MDQYLLISVMSVPLTFVSAKKQVPTLIPLLLHLQLILLDIKRHSDGIAYIFLCTGLLHTVYHI